MSGDLAAARREAEEALAGVERERLVSHIREAAKFATRADRMVFLHDYEAKALVVVIDALRALLAALPGEGAEGPRAKGDCMDCNGRGFILIGDGHRGEPCACVTRPTVIEHPCGCYAPDGDRCYRHAPDPVREAAERLRRLALQGAIEAPEALDEINALLYALASARAAKGGE